MLLPPSDDEDAKSKQQINEMVVGVPQASIQCLLLLILTILVTVFHERGRPGDLALIALQTWSVTAAEPCHPYETSHNCFNTTMADSGATADAIAMYERPQGELNQRLFNLVSVPFLILCSHVISTPFYIGYIRQSSKDNSHSSSSNLQKNLKRIAMLMLMIFACSFLFLQTTWRLPGNNLLLCELWLIAALFYISFHPASHYSEYARHKYTPSRFLEFAFSLPLLAVAASGTAGMTDVDELNWIFFTSLFMCLFVLCLEFHHHKTTILKEEPDTLHHQASAVLLLNALFCLVAFLVPAARTVQQGIHVDANLEWGPISLVLLMMLHVLYFLTVAAFRLLSLFETHAIFIFLLDGIGIVGRTAISLVIISGALDLQSA